MVHACRDSGSDIPYSHYQIDNTYRRMLDELESKLCYLYDT